MWPMIAIYKKDQIIYTIADSGLNAEDAATLVNALRDHTEKNMQAKWYMEMGDFKKEGKNTDGSPDFLFPESNRLKKIALVGDKIWQERFTELLLPFSEAHIKYFGPEDGNMASNWLEQASNSNSN